MDVIYFTYDNWITTRPEDIIHKCLYDRPGAPVLGYTQRYKNGGNDLLLYESNEGSNEAIFE